MHFSKGVAGVDFGVLIAETGVMFSGKTRALIHRLEQQQRVTEILEKSYTRKGNTPPNLSIGGYKHAIDKRYAQDEIASHNGNFFKAKPVSSVAELMTDIYKNDYRIIGIDEIQFFDEKDDTGFYEITYALKQLADENRLVIVAGLDKDFRGLPFGPMGDILAISDQKYFHESTCAVCGGAATLPQRLIEGKPAFFDDPIKLVGANDSYEPRCRVHHLVTIREKQPSI